MRRDQYEPDKFFMGIQTLSSEIDADLAQLHQALDDDDLFGRVKVDVVQRYQCTQRTGRPSSPVEVVRRMLVVKRIYNSARCSALNSSLSGSQFWTQALIP